MEKLSRRHSRQPKHDQDCPPGASAPTTLYRLYDAEGVLLYVGITANREQRWEGHRRSSSWWKQVARKELSSYPSRKLAVIAERNAVRKELPVHNVEYTYPDQPKSVAVTLYPQQIKKLNRLAQQRGLSRAALLRQIIDAA
ncbi:GIY-YIG nuclease family protein [Streptomyces sp. SBT349]|uniref:GIY-YIG nuclease family protein n=1 Tax=Streptomyces sp. SBT349 TaxID=1580539 RepID=UPI00066A2D72|nr:GIY-YIG nuclease family protein [Streptomyces sp. SBT349]